MTPEALRDYIVGKGFSEDVAQDIVVAYLTTQRPIRYPKSWAWERAIRLRDKAAFRAVRALLGSETPNARSMNAYANPLRQAANRQELSRIMSKDKPPASRRKGKGRVWGWPKHQADYRALVQQDAKSY